VIHRFLIVPGFTNSGPRHWQTLFEQKFHNARRVQMPDWDHPERDAWVAALDAAIQQSDTPPVLIAHSCGVAAVVHWATHATHPVHAAMLVAPADPASDVYPEELRSFAPLPEVTLPFRSTLVASSNDPYCSLEAAHRYARAWGSHFADAGEAGHINTDAGFGPWPTGERLLNELLRA
jgi:predicted alpha/beta hydrolase family esterase